MNKRLNKGALYASPIGVWMLVFFVLPTLVIVAFSFLKKGLHGGVLPVFTLDAYLALLNPSFLKVVMVTLSIAFFSTLITILLAIPASYYIARSPLKNSLLLLVIIPFWTNLLIRVFAWIAILGNNGFINQFLVSLGITHDHFQLLYNQQAVILVTVYTCLPYAILPLYSTIEKFDFSLLEAARDLGATKAQSMFHIFLPNIRAGIITAVIFTLIPTLGSYAIPQLVGGRDSMMVGNIIARQLTVERNWPLASSMSVILTLITMLGVWVFMRVNSQQASRPRKPA